MSRLDNRIVKPRSKIRVLCFTDTNSGRDVEMILPLRYFAERVLNCEFRHAVSFDLYEIYRTKPDIIVTPNITGSRLFYRIARTAAEQHIPLFSLISEGNFKTDGTYDYWGYNTDRTFFQEYVCCWSKRTRDYLAEREPAASNKIVVTGHLGCDRYVIYEPIRREEFLKKYNLPPYKRIIGYAGWTFNKIRFPRGIRELLQFYGDDASILLWVERQRTLVREILSETIRNNKDTLFILKRHPQDTSPELVQQAVNELDGLCDLENVLCLGEEEGLHDVIAVCDLWTCFESTTALEAWLLKKPTVFLNPDPEFKRADLVKGSVVARNSAELQGMIGQLYDTGSIPEFCSVEKVQQRQRQIADSVGYADGFNHLRAAYYFMRVVKGLPDAVRPHYRSSPVQVFFHFFTILGGMFYIRSLYKHLYKLKKHLWVFENYTMEGLERLYTRYSLFLQDFYAKQGIEEQYRAGTLFGSIFDGNVSGGIQNQSVQDGGTELSKHNTLIESRGVL